MRTGRKHILSILVENKPGVLTRIAGLFARRGFNIDTLAVGPTEDERFSRITLTLDGAVHPIDQVTKQLHKLVNVLKIRDLEPEETLARELALFKVSADGPAATEVMQICEIFRAKIVDVTRRSVVVRGDGHVRQDRGVRAARAAVRADRDGPHRRDRDLAWPGRDLAPPVGRLRASHAAGGRLERWLDTATASSGCEQRWLPRCAAPGRRGRRRSRASPARSTRRRDPTAVALASRRAGEPWFCFEQPDRDGWALAALGCVRALEARGEDRFAAVSRRWRTVAARRGRRPTATDRPARASSRSAASRSRPTGASRRTGGTVRAGVADRARGVAARGGAAARALTVNVEVAPDDTVEELLAARRRRRLAELRTAPLPLLDPSPTGTYRVHSPMPPSHYEEAVARGGAADPGGRAREDRARAGGRRARADRRTTRPRCSALLREEFASCYVFAVGRGDGDVPRRQPRAAGPARGPAREHGRARRLDRAQRRSRRRRPPRRAAAAQRQGPRGERDRRAADRPRAAPATRCG